MCVPTTPPALTFHHCVAKLNEEGEHKMEEKFGWIPEKKQAGWLKPGRPAWDFRKNYQNTLTGAEQTEPEPVQKGSPRVATGSGRPAGPTCRPSPGPLRVLTVCHLYSLFLPGVIQFHSKSCQLKSNKTLG